jgi:N-carbamoylputrescine amidase
MKVTVCELNDEPEAFQRDWAALTAHVRQRGSELVLLPELPFTPWFARSPVFNPERWEAAVGDHERWLLRLPELAPAAVLATRPLTRPDGQRVNEGFLWTRKEALQAAHTKYYLPDEEGFWEASWYGRGEKDFTPFQAGRAEAGFLICTELWFFEHARAYGREGVHLIANPRATLAATRDKWLAGGRAAAVVGGAFCLSSNHVSPAGSEFELGGQGWIIAPDGEVLALTTPAEPIVTLEVDLGEAERAKGTYPRYVRE